ncbi:MAG: hypothetical protein HC927_06285 [Deltaproteobacteria bacterium]|nr:hypothetical protein [Deltaproteobacteria bacterium]
MARIVYGLFEQASAAEVAADELRTRSDAHPTFSVQTHAEAPLDGNYLPESATEIGRNTMIAVVAGAIGGAIIGALAASLFDIMGLTLAIGVLFGAVTGVLLGLLGGMMAGTRQAKPALREFEGDLGKGAVLVTVEVDDPGHVELVARVLERAGGTGVGNC